MTQTQRSIDTKALRAFAGESPRGWPTCKAQSERLRKFVAMNRARRVPSEAMARVVLENHSRHKWKPQVQWGNRIFDFWCHKLGVAIEIDGPEHRRDRDLAQDRWQARRSAIVTFRVPSGDYRKLRRVIDVTQRLGSRDVRKRRVACVAKRKLGRSP